MALRSRTLFKILLVYLVSLFEYQPGEAQKTFRVSFNKIFHFTALTLSLGIVISLIHAAWYPSSKLFFLLSDAQAEEEFAFSIFQEPTWRAIGRVILLVRTILLYTVIAPRPYVFLKEVGGSFPRFNFFKIAPETFSYSSYNGLGNLLVIAWVILLLAAGMLLPTESHPHPQSRPFPCVWTKCPVQLRLAHQLWI